jgi:signal transduction histidine kinase
LFGRPLTELSGSSLSQLFPTLSSLLPISKLYAHSRVSRGIDAEAVGRDGSRIPVHITVSESVETRRKRYVLVARDFRAVRFGQQRVLHRERLAAIGETMTALAHESRNALQRMHSCITLLKLRGNADVQELVADLQDAQEQLQRLYEEVRSFAAPLRLQLRMVDIEHLLKRTWRQLRMQWAPKKIVWSSESAPGANAKIRADPARLGQVFRNVFENAIEVSPNAGRIAVRLAKTTKDGDPALEITIDDQGPGIGRELRNQVFELLYTTKQDGTGMGLAISRRILGEHSGAIAVGESILGGTAMVITLPLADGSEGDGRYRAKSSR